jgi:hypothetical protein
MPDEKQEYVGWAILELMGHRRIAGFVCQAEMYGAAMLRIDIPNTDGTTAATQFYGGASIYCLTPTTEEIARAVAMRTQPQPVQRWEMAPPVSAKEEAQLPYGDGYDPDDDHDYTDDETD